MGTFGKLILDVGLIFTLLVVIIGQTEAYTSPYPECSRVDYGDRVQCGIPSIHNRDVAACLRQLSGDNLCCYDDDIPPSVTAPQCYVAAPILSPPSVGGTGTQGGFAPLTPGGSSSSGGFVPPVINPIVTTTLAPRTTSLAGFAPVIQATVSTPNVGSTTTTSSSAAPTVNFTPTSDLLGNTIPQGPVSNIFPTAPGQGTESPEVALANLLEELGISITDFPGAVTVGSSISSITLTPPGPTQPLDNIDRTVALCTSINNGQIPESIQTFFSDVLDQCRAINTTVSPAEADAFLRREVQMILQQNNAGGGSAPSTTAPPVSNNLQNLFSILGNNGGATNANVQPGNNINTLILNALTGSTTPAPTTQNPIQALLSGSGSGTNPLLTALMGSLGGSSTGSNTGINSILSSLTGNTAGSNNGVSALISSLSGNNGASSSNGILSSLLGNSGSSSSGGSNSALTSLLLNSLTQQRPTAANRQDLPVGAQLPDFIGTTAAPVYNPIVCNLLLGNNGLLSSLSSGSTLSSFLLLPFRQNLLQQFGCLNNLISNPLLLLQGGGGLDSLRDTLGPLLGLTSSTGDETVGNELTGPLDPALIPPDSLTQCLNERATLNIQNNCKVGIHVNIRTEQECYNIGCVYAPGGMCFRCPYIPVSAQVNQLAQPTCSVASTERTDCPGFQQTFLLSTIFSQQQLINSRSATSGSSSTGPQVAARSGASSSGNSSVSASEANDSGNSSAPLNAPVPRQGIFGNLAGLGGLGSLTGGSSTLTNQLLQRNCESRDCCWDSSTTLLTPASSCYSRANPTLPENSADCISSLNCGVAASSFLARIIGGEQVPSITDRPWQALIRLRGSDIVRCSGAIICSQWIVTAASCIERISSLNAILGFSLELSPTSLEVFVGTSNVAVNAASALSVTQIIPHPLYVVTQNIHNIALLQIPTLQTSLTVAPVCIPPFGSSSIGNNQTIYVDGYGQTATAPQSNLREIVASTYDTTLCRNIYQTSLPNAGVFCALPVNAGEDTCTGDGGAPALTFNSASSIFTLVGINIGGSADCSGNQPMVFLDIADYREWIRQTTNGCCSVISTRLG